MESNKIIPKGILFPFILLTTLFFAWAVPNNLTDTMLAAFKRIMSMSDSKTAWIQVVCYLLGYGCCAVPGALFIKKYTYKSCDAIPGMRDLSNSFFPYFRIQATKAERVVRFLLFLL